MAEPYLRPGYDAVNVGVLDVLGSTDTDWHILTSASFYDQRDPGVVLGADKTFAWLQVIVTTAATAADLEADRVHIAFASRAAGDPKTNTLVATAGTITPFGCRGDSNSRVKTVSYAKTTAATKLRIVAGFDD